MSETPENTAPTGANPVPKPIYPDVVNSEDVSAVQQDSQPPASAENSTEVTTEPEAPAQIPEVVAEQATAQEVAQPEEVQKSEEAPEATAEPKKEEPTHMADVADYGQKIESQTAYPAEQAAAQPMNVVQGNNMPQQDAVPQQAYNMSTVPQQGAGMETVPPQAAMPQQDAGMAVMPQQAYVPQQDVGAAAVPYAGEAATPASEAEIVIEFEKLVGNHEEIMKRLNYTALENDVATKFLTGFSKLLASAQKNARAKSPFISVKDFTERNDMMNVLKLYERFNEGITASLTESMDSMTQLIKEMEERKRSYKSEMADISKNLKASEASIQQAKENVSRHKAEFFRFSTDLHEEAFRWNEKAKLLKTVSSNSHKTRICRDLDRLYANYEKKSNLIASIREQYNGAILAVNNAIYQSQEGKKEFLTKSQLAIHNHNVQMKQMLTNFCFYFEKFVADLSKLQQQASEEIAAVDPVSMHNDFVAGYTPQQEQYSEGAMLEEPVPTRQLEMRPVPTKTLLDDPNLAPAKKEKKGKKKSGSKSEKKGAAAVPAAAQPVPVAGQVSMPMAASMQVPMQGQMYAGGYGAQSMMQSQQGPPQPQQQAFGQPPVVVQSNATNAGLPPGWEQRIDQNGRAYYVDHNTRTTTYAHPYAQVPMAASFNAQAAPQPAYQQQQAQPIVQGQSSPQQQQIQPPQAAVQMPAQPMSQSVGPVKPLPQGWEERFDANNNMVYYIDHNTRTTTFERPS